MVKRGVDSKGKRGWIVYSSKGKRLSRAYSTHKEAGKRLGEIEWFKKHKR